MSRLALLAALAWTPAPPDVADPFPTGPIGNIEEDYPQLTASAGSVPNVDPPTGGALMQPGRSLRWFFDDEDVSLSWVDGTDLSTWQVRDYEGQVVAAGTDPTSPLSLGSLPVGWYKLYLTRGTDVGLPFRTSGGEATFIVSRRMGLLQDVELPSSQISGGSSAVTTVPATHAYVGHGSMRIDAKLWPSDPVKWRHDLDLAVQKASDCAPYLINEGGSASRVIFASIVDGTGGETPSAQVTAQLTQTVQELVAAGVFWFEGQNEPVGFQGWQVAEHYAAFAATVHAAHPDAKVMGPCPVSVTSAANGSGPPWLRAFLAAGGGDHIDGLSFHPYNAVENDLNLGRYNYSALVDLLTEFNVQDKPRFMTEYGTFATVYGSYEPRWQAQVVMLDWHLLWQIAGVHRNRAYYFYDLSHGFWSYPSFLFANSSGVRNPNPLPLMFRTWVEETWGMDLISPLDFGPVEGRHMVGSLFKHANGHGCVTIQTSGRVGVQVSLSVAGAASLTLVDPFGAMSSAPVTGGLATIEVGPEPVHVRIPVDVTVSVVPRDYGTDVTPRATLTPSAPTYGTGFEKVADGDLLTSWSAMVGDSGPSWWRMDFAAPVTFDAVEVICRPPWQHSSSLLDFDIQALVDGYWQVIHREVVPAPSVEWTTRPEAGGTWVDSFWDRRRIFVAHLEAPLTAEAVRVYARRFSFGGGATIDQARTLRKLDSQGRATKIGQAGRPRLTLQEVTLYRQSA